MSARDFPGLTVGQRKILPVFGIFPRLMIRQVTRLLYDDSSYEHVASKLRELEKSGYLLHTRRNGTNLPGDPYVYAPTLQGRKWLASVGYEFFGRYADRNERGKSISTLPHSLDSSDVLITTVCAGRANERIHVGELRHEEHLQRELAGRFKAIPDGFVRLTVAGEPMPFFVEVDRSGGEGEREWRGKLDAYLHYGNPPFLEYFGVGTLDILVVVTLPDAAKGERRMRRLIGWTEAYLRENRLTGFADCFSFTAAPAAGRIGEHAVRFFGDAHWHSPFRPEPRPFF